MCVCVCVCVRVRVCVLIILLVIMLLQGKHLHRHPAHRGTILGPAGQSKLTCIHYVLFWECCSRTVSQ